MPMRGRSRGDARVNEVLPYPQPAALRPEYVGRIAFLASATEAAAAARERLAARYGDAPGRRSGEVIVALGGDGFMLETLHGCSAASRSTA